MGDPFDEQETEQSVTIDEYINNLESEELEADLILGGDEGKECTYSMGYVKRQAIFSCLTCCPGGNAGVCQACCLSCHDGHEIVELWTKRNFRCDCGNSKFGESFCKLQPSKDVENFLNSYNHNFKGLYCTCGRPYPDPNVEEQEEMIQCIICEDWFHEEHLGLGSLNEIPRNEENEPIYEDFLCKACVGVCSFLMLYPSSIQATGKQLSDSATNISKEKQVMDEIPSAGGPGKVMTDTLSDGSLGKSNTVADANCSSGKTFDGGESSEMGSRKSTEDGSLHVTCLLDSNGVATAVLESKPMFLSGGWRDTLCKCGKCLDMYNQKGVSYLLDREDSIAEYEKMAKQRREEKLRKQEGDASNFLNGLGHVEKIEMLSAIEDFKDEFRSFLENFDSSKAVTSSDINQIFTNLAKKRRRMQ